jgi:hypothetical protein
LTSQEAQQHIVSKNPFERAKLVAATYELLLHSLTKPVKDSVDAIMRHATCTHNQRATAAGGAVIALHVRRGDSCEAFNGFSNDDLRRCFQLSDYVTAARRLIRQYSLVRPTLKVLTDSPSVVKQLQTEHKDLNFCYIHFNRTVVGGKENVNLHTKDRKERVYIEDRSMAGDVDNKLVLESILADLLFASDAGYIVGRWQYRLRTLS